MTMIITTLGSKAATELGLILPHEHIFVDFRSPDTKDKVALLEPPRS